MSLVILFTLMLWSNTLLAVDLRLCNIDSGFGKYTRQDEKGIWQLKLKEAFKHINADLKIHFLPRKRCLLEVEQNDADAIFSAINTNRLSYLVYPKKSNGEIDSNKSIGRIIFKIYKFKSSDLDWDGSKFINLNDKVIGAQRGLDPGDILPKYLSKPVELLTSNEQLFSMFILKRLSAIVIEENQAVELLKGNKNSEITAIKTPFSESTIYLTFSKKFYEKNPKLAEEIWNQLAKLK